MTDFYRLSCCHFEDMLRMQASSQLALHSATPPTGPHDLSQVLGKEFKGKPGKNALFRQRDSFTSGSCMSFAVIKHVALKIKIITTNVAHHTHLSLVTSHWNNCRSSGSVLRDLSSSSPEQAWHPDHYGQLSWTRPTTSL